MQFFKIPLNIPNILSLYRLLSFPMVLGFALYGQERLFAIFIIINLVTDILDGFIARKFNLQTKIGAKLDSIADLGTFILAFIGIYQFKWSDFEPHLISWYLFIGLFILAELIPLIKFKKFASFHLYSWKIGGYIQGFFFFLLFAFKFYPIYYYIMVVLGIMAFLEHITISLMIKNMKINAKGLYWVLKEKNESN